MPIDWYQEHWAQPGPTAMQQQLGNMIEQHVIRNGIDAHPDITAMPGPRLTTTPRPPTLAQLQRMQITGRTPPMPSVGVAWTLTMTAVQNGVRVLLTWEILNTDSVAPGIEHPRVTPIPVGPPMIIDLDSSSGSDGDSE